MPNFLVVEVSDDGLAASASAAAGVAGRGIRGMRERAEQAGGELSSGPREHGSAGWTTRVRFPAGALDSDVQTQGARVDR